MESNLKEKFKERNRSVEDFFRTNEFAMKKKVKKVKKDTNKCEDPKDYLEFQREGVIVKDMKAWTDMVINSRGLDLNNTMIQLGFDNGQGVLKLMQTIKSSDLPKEICSSQKRRYSEG